MLFIDKLCITTILHISYYIGVTLLSDYVCVYFFAVDLNELLKKYEDEEKRQLELQEQEDEALVKSIFRQEETVKRLKDNEDESGISSCQQQQLRASAGTKRPPTNLLGKQVYSLILFRASLSKMY